MNLLLKIIILVKDKTFLKIEPNTNSVGQIIRSQEVLTPKYLFLANKNNQP